MQWRIQGCPGARPPIYLAKSIWFFYIVYNVWKIFLKLNLDFIVAEIRGVFGSVRVYACVCVNRNRGRYRFLFSKGPILNDIRGHSDPKIYARLQEIASNFLKISGGGPQTSRRLAPSAFCSGLPPLTATPFQNSWIRPWNVLLSAKNYEIRLRFHKAVSV